MGPGTGPRTSLRPPTNNPPPPPPACSTCKPPARRRRTGTADAEGSAGGGTAQGKAHAWAGSQGADDSPNRARVMGGQVSGTATANRNGASVEASGTVAGAQLRGSNVNARGNGLTGEMDVLSAQANGRAGVTRNGYGAQGQASATMARMSGTATGSLGGVQQTVGAEGKIMSAGVRGDALLGDDGRRVGIALGGKAEAAAASVSASSKTSINIPFTNWSIGTEGSVEASAGSAAIGGGGYAYMDRADGRYKAGVFGKIAAVFGVEIDREISIGPRTPPGK